MGRNLKFDRNTALDAATKLFWEQGYLNTSIKQLLTVMNLGESSFYHSFKSKKKLYISCLKHYSKSLKPMRDRLINKHESPNERIHDYFIFCVKGMYLKSIKSCLLINSLCADTIEQPEIKEYIFDTYDKSINVLEKIIQEGIDTNEFNDSLDPYTTANILFSYLHGLIKLSFYNFDLEERLTQTDIFLNAVLKTN